MSEERRRLKEEPSSSRVHHLPCLRTDVAAPAGADSRAERALEVADSRVSEDDVLLVLYSGHVSSIKDKTGGSPTENVKVLVPRDASLAADTPTQLLPVPDVARAFRAAKARTSVLIIDG
jgi:hypothetical protein